MVTTNQIEMSIPESTRFTTAKNCRAAVEGEDHPIRFEDLIERCMGNIDLAKRLLEQSEGHLLRDLQALKQDKSDPVEVARLAHRLKGATANVGAIELRDAFAQIEELGRSGDLASLPESLLDLEAPWARFTEGVATLCEHT